MTNIYYKSTYRTTMTNNINIMQWICTGNHSMTSDESVAHIKVGSINSIFYFLHKAAEPFNCLEQDNLA